MANPLEKTLETSPPKISTKTYHICGILTTVLGLSELPPSCSSISVLWLLHPRLQKAETMIPLGSLILNSWATRRASLPTTHPAHSKGLIAVTFDQRNHGTREVHPPANGSWRDGNESHAQDMFGVIHGTGLDTSLLMDHLGSYIFQELGREIPILQHLTLGISLGGHAAWQIFFSEPRIEAAAVIIGCPDYMRVMADRARLSKRKTHVQDNGDTFLGSPDFPTALVSSVEKWDPRGLLFGTSPIPLHPSGSEQTRLREIFNEKIKGKSLLVCSGGADKLVPYHASQPFMDFLKNAVGKGGWYEEGLSVDDIVYEGVGHAMSDGMVRDSIIFLGDLLEGKVKGKESRM